MTQVLIDRATLEQLVAALEASIDGDHPYYDDQLTAIEALRTALAQQELPQKERPDFMAGYDEGMADAKRMAQQGEPTDDQLVKGVKAMRLFVTKNSVADFKLGYMAALAAAPQAQDPIAKLFGTLPVYDTPAPQPAQGVGRTNPGDETCGAVERFGWQTFLGKSPEIIPATNGSFVWYSDYLKLWQSAQPVHQGERAELIRRLLAIANTEANEVADALNEAADMLQSAQPVAQPLAKTCDTCAHYQQGKHPGVSIHDETCYECRSYWGNKWEAA